MFNHEHELPSKMRAAQPEKPAAPRRAGHNAQHRIRQHFRARWKWDGMVCVSESPGKAGGGALRKHNGWDYILIRSYKGIETSTGIITEERNLP